MFTALAIITDAYERCNRLSPGEVVNADDAARAFDRLNLLVDEMSAAAGFLFRSVLTSASQAGNITLGVGDWAAIAPGALVSSVSVDGAPLAAATMQQFNAVRNQGAVGMPQVYVHDGLATVYLYPLPNGQTVRIETSVGVSEFADQTTVYNAPPGYKAALGAALAVRMAPVLLGGIPDYLLRAEMRCMGRIDNYEPGIVDVLAFNRGGGNFNIMFGGSA